MSDKKLLKVVLPHRPTTNELVDGLGGWDRQFWGRARKEGKIAAARSGATYRHDEEDVRTFCRNLGWDVQYSDQ